MTMREKFKSWWLASKYHQVVRPQTHWEQIALDAYCEAYRAGAESMREKVAKYCDENPYTDHNRADRIRAMSIEEET